MKELNGAELAGFVKERQAHVVQMRREDGLRAPKLVILRDSDNPVIAKYVGLKKRYGEDIGVEVLDVVAKNVEDLKAEILKANADESVSGIIVQLPLATTENVDEVVKLITSEKDVDGLTGHGRFDSATATAINWLCAGYDVLDADAKIALVGRGRLVGGPLEKMWLASGRDVTTFVRGDDLNLLRDFDVIVTATGVPHLIKNEMVRGGAVVIDAGTASEDGVLVGDVDDAVRERTDLRALTPRIGGVGPLTVSVLFENVIAAAK